MKRFVPVLLLSLPGVMVCATAVAQKAANEVTDNEVRMRVLLREGAGLLKEAKYDDARKRLLEAWKIRPNPDVGAVLGQAELLVGLYRDAASHLDWTLKNFSPARPEKSLQSVRELYAQALTHVAMLRITASRQGVEVRVDGQTVGSAPLGADVFVEVGKHVISAGTAAEQSIATEPGQTYTLVFDIPEEPAAAPLSTPTPPSKDTRTMLASAMIAQPPTERSVDMTPVYWTLGVGAGLTAGSLVAALLFHGHASSKESDAHSLSARAGNCSGATRPECQQLASLTDDRNSANTMALVSVGGAAVFAAATGIVTYLVWPRSEKQPPAQPVAWAAPGSGGVGVSGSF